MRSGSGSSRRQSGCGARTAATASSTGLCSPSALPPPRPQLWLCSSRPSRQEARRSSTSSPGPDRKMRRIRRSPACERGDALIEGLFALALVLLVVAVGAQALAYAHARSVAAAAAQDGARAAAASGPEAGVTRANAILDAAGGAGANLRASAPEASGDAAAPVDRYRSLLTLPAP